jgi:hypothetical protein
MIVDRKDLERLAELIAERVWKTLAERIARGNAFHGKVTTDQEAK